MFYDCCRQALLYVLEDVFMLANNVQSFESDIKFKITNVLYILQ